MNIYLQKSLSKRFHSCSKLLHKDEKLFNTKIEMKFCDNEVHLQEEIGIFYLEKLVFKVMLQFFFSRVRQVKNHAI